MNTLNTFAERYVKLVLALGEHDPAYVDAYYGPPEWKTGIAAEAATLGQVADEAVRLLDELAHAKPAAEAEELVQLRHTYLTRQLESLRARVRMLSGERLTFDEESLALYDAVAPTLAESEFQQTLDELDALLPGKGALLERYNAFRDQFIVAFDKLDLVFQLAIDECRARTLAHVTLPSDESFTVEYVTGKSWSGYNWYQGSYRSLIQVNTELPIHIDRAITLACHEGYPGHHLYNVLLEERLLRQRGWVEASVYALFSPQSLIAEGTANYGIEIAFPGDERVGFEREHLFPAAALDPDRAEEFYAVHGLVERLSYAGNETARRYLNGEIDRAAAARWLTRYALSSPERAEQRTRFIDDYRSYVINYTLGQDLVKQFVERRAGSPPSSERRWKEFIRLLGSPRLPSGLQ